MPDRSGTRTALRWETGVVLTAMCGRLVPATVYRNETWAALLDGPRPPLAAGFLATVSLAASWLLCGSGRRALGAVGYAVTALRVTGVLAAGLLIAQELYGHATAGVPNA